jgi:hypothetical protein
MKNQLNILVLHSLGDPKNCPYFLPKHVFMLQKYCPENNYLYHDVALPLPEYVKRAEFDLILLDVTFLAGRWLPKKLFLKLKADYDFIKDSNSVKIAFPQDEYDHNQILDEWMVDWNIDIVYSVISDNWNILYPKFHKTGHIKLAYTGYIETSLIDFSRKPFNLRTIDLGYRARKLLPYFGRIGEIKSSIAEDVLAKASQITELNLDIAVGEKATFHGLAWLEFINDSKFTLGSNSGSSLLDSHGEIQKKVKQFLINNPKANFDEVEKYCFPGEDGKWEFTAISPRIIEASLLDSCQVLVEGKYSGLLEPWKNYIPIKADASNWDEVYLAMKDRTLVQSMITETRLKLSDFKDLRAEERALEILSDASAFHAKKKVKTNIEEICTALDKYKKEMHSGLYKRVWFLRNCRQRLIRGLDRYPYIKNIVREIYYKFL